MEPAAPPFFRVLHAAHEQAGSRQAGWAAVPATSPPTTTSAPACACPCACAVLNYQVDQKYEA